MILCGVVLAVVGTFVLATGPLEPPTRIGIPHILHRNMGEEQKAYLSRIEPWRQLVADINRDHFLIYETLRSMELRADTAMERTDSIAVQHGIAWLGGDNSYWGNTLTIQLSRKYSDTSRYAALVSRTATSPFSWGATAVTVSKESDSSIVLYHDNVLFNDSGFVQWFTSGELP
jgi:hypothetical protein